MAMNFNNILNDKIEDIKRPPNVPVGTYRASVKSIPEIIQRGDFEILEFQMQLVEAQEDVSAEDLAAYGGLGPLSRLRRSFLFNTTDDAAFKRTEYDLRRFLADHLKCATDDMALKEAINASMGAQCLVFVNWTQDKNDAELQHSNIARTAPLA